MEYLFKWPGEWGVHQTLGVMRDIVNESFWHPLIREKAAQVVAVCKNNGDCEELTILGYVNSVMRYLKDPYKVEGLHHPVTWVERRLRTGQTVYGDCDDMSMYIASLLKAVGHSPKFKAISRTGLQYHHVLVVCESGRELDATLGFGLTKGSAMKSIQMDI